MVLEEEKYEGGDVEEFGCWEMIRGSPSPVEL